MFRIFQVCEAARRMEQREGGRRWGAGMGERRKEEVVGVEVRAKEVEVRNGAWE